MDPWSVLTSQQAAVARPFLAAREADRKHLVMYLSGAHAYGFPSPDSDLDLKCIHIAPTSRLVGLLLDVSDPPDRIEVVDGVELDYGSNELAVALRGAIKGNGNFLERILGELVLGGDTTLLAEARELVRPLLSRRIARHYAGFALSQLRGFDDKPTAKRALYVLRTTATGRHLLATGELVTDVARLAEYVPSAIGELMAAKRRGEKEVLEPDVVLPWRARLAHAIHEVDASIGESVLPVEPDAKALAAVDTWLRDLRKRFW